MQLGKLPKYLEVPVSSTWTHRLLLSQDLHMLKTASKWNLYFPMSSTSMDEHFIPEVRFLKIASRSFSDSRLL